MATALATLPLMGVTAGALEMGLTAAGVVGVACDAPATGGLADGLTAAGTAAFAGCLEGMARVAAGLAAFFVAVLLTDAFLGATLPATDLAAGRFTAAPFFDEAALEAAGLADFLATVLGGTAAFTAGFFATAFLTTDFLATAFLATGFADFFALGFFAATFFAAGLFATGLPEAAFFAAALAGAAFFAGRALMVRAVAAAAFNLLLPASLALLAAFPFCAFAAVELRVVFAISLHHFGRGGRVL